MNVRFEHSFLKDLKRVKGKIIKSKIEKQINIVKEAANLTALINLKKITGTRNAFRLKIGDYRIGIFHDNNEFIFVRVMHRKDIYHYFP